MFVYEHNVHIMNEYTEKWIHCQLSIISHIAHFFALSHVNYAGYPVTVIEKSVQIRTCRSIMAGGQLGFSGR